jgi:predicted short-subunit dehydrogenase-like oxidoreductase (DUF2520 family)
VSAPTVFFVGAGRVGRGLSRAFRASGVEVRGVHARTPRSGVTSTGTIPATALDATAIIVAVPDAAINDALIQIASIALERSAASRACILFTSGSAQPAAAADLRRNGLALAMMHPLLPFSGDADLDAERLRDGWVGISGDAKACDVAAALVRAVGAHTVIIPEGSRALYHAGAVFASNFPLVLAHVAQALLVECRIAGADAIAITRALLTAAAENVRSKSVVEVLTGPAVRADADVIAAQLAAIEEVKRSVPHAADAYRNLSAIALQIAQLRGADPDRLAAASQVLREP